jgi:hypothetical protein
VSVPRAVLYDTWLVLTSNVLKPDQRLSPTTTPVSHVLLHCRRRLALAVKPTSRKYLLRTAKCQHDPDATSVRHALFAAAHHPIRQPSVRQSESHMRGAGPCPALSGPQEQTQLQLIDRSSRGPRDGGVAGAVHLTPHACCVFVPELPRLGGRGGESGTYRDLTKNAAGGRACLPCCRRGCHQAVPAGPVQQMKRCLHIELAEH